MKSPSFPNTALMAFLVLEIAGCAEPNAVLDVQMHLPPVGGRDVAWVQVNTAGANFDDLWDTDPFPFDLEATENACNIRFSVEAPTPRSDRDAVREIRLKVWFCASDDSTCDDSNAPLWRITLQQPLYAGERTSWVLAGTDALGCVPLTVDSTLPDVVDPSFELSVDKCQISGCVDGVAAAGRDFCEDAERTRHSCE
jgi:hypothetical protein